MPSQERIRPRIVVTTDPECDDSNSLVRFLLYSTDFQVEGLIYASSQFHWKGDGRGTKWFVEGREYTRFGLNMGPMESWRWPEGDSHIEDAVEVYGRVYPNLKAHDPDYPSPGELESKIRYGNIEFDGDISKDSPGSDLIKSLMLDDVPGPLYITACGGQSTIARALKSIQEQYENTPEWESIREKVSSKVVLLPSGDQDDVYANYIRPNWPEIDYRQFSSGAGFGYGAQSRATAENAVYYTSSWMNEHISSQGPLGAFYRVWGDGKQMVEGDIFDYFGFSGYTDDELREMGYIVWLPVQEKGSWLGEGDTPTFMNLLDNGLRAYEDASYGGWGGYRLTASAAGLSPWQGDFGGASLQGAQGATGPGYPDFFQEAQNDFVTRLHWSVTPEYAEANHEPEASIEGPLSVTAHPGETVRLAGEVSDPDGDPVSIKWWEFQAADSYEGEVTIASPTSASTDVVVPADAEPGQTIHMILEVTDNAPLPLTRYQRVIITVQGE
ncbi:MAG: DUF1593 domain-containing protein [Fidelibacterota bacterium]|nr:MAG: DUF1593 domain-containing protein [Candidatus Neomarinimicrobiota bacterium]